MYDIYISHHKNPEGTAIVTTEELLFSVPITQSNRSVINPIVKNEMGKAGSFEFSILPTHPFYDRFVQLMTVMRVTYGGQTIFRGRVLTIDTNNMTGVKQIHLEGDLAFLMDSYIEGKADAYRPVQSIYSYLQQLINNHNSQMDYAIGSHYKKFTLGEVPGHYSTATSEQRITIPNEKFGGTSWQKTSDAFTSLTNEYGGYLRTRYVNNVCYLDWLESYFGTGINTQPIQISENLINISNTSEVENIFTVLIPIGSKDGNSLYIEGYNEQYHGHNKSITVKQVYDYLVATGRTAEMDKGFHDKNDFKDSITNYGVIYRTQDFGNEDTQQKLWDTTIKWIVDNYHGGISSFNITALDLHHVDENAYSPYMLGDRITVIYPDQSQHTSGNTPTLTKTWTCTSLQYVLYNPERDTYTIGIPNSLLGRAYNKRSNNKKSGGGGSGSGAVKTPEQKIEEEELKEEVADHERAAMRFIINEQYNNEKFLQLQQENPKAAEKALELAYASIVRGLTASEDPNHQFDEEYTNKVQALIIDPNDGYFKILGERLPAQSAQAEANVIATNNMAESIVYNFVSGEMTVKQKLDLGQGPLTDEAIAKYVMYYGTNDNKKKDLQKVTVGTTSVFNSPELTMQTFQLTPGTITSDDPLGLLGTVSKVSTVTSASNGKIQSYETGIGINNLDGTEIYDTIKNSGADATSIWMDPLNAGSTSDADKNVEIKGGGTNGGEIGVGKLNNDWTISLNKNLVWYEDNPQDPQHPIEHRVPAGTVGAKDYYLENLPSFRSEFAYINTFMADQIVTNRLIVQNEAFINNLKSNDAIVDQITAKIVGGLNGNFGGVSATVVSSTGFNLSDGSQTISSLEDCFIGCTPTVGTGADAGKIILTFTRASGSNELEVPFDITDMEYFNQAMSDAEETGWTLARGYVVGTLPKQGQEQTALDTAWNVNIPTTTYDDYEQVPITIEGPTTYTYNQQTYDVVTAKVGNYKAYIKSINITDLSQYNTVVSNAQNDGWTLARGYVVGTLPKQGQEQTALNTAWNVNVPNTTYDTYTQVPITIEGPTTYTYNQQTYDVVTAKVGNHKAYIKSINITDLSQYNTVVSNAQNTGWTLARGYVVGTLPKQGQEQTALNTAWNVNVPNTTYDTYTQVPITIEGPTTYTYNQQTYDVVTAKVGNHKAYIKSINVGTPEIHDANDQKVVGPITINSTQYFTPMVTFGSGTKSGTMIEVRPQGVPSDTWVYDATSYSSAHTTGYIGAGQYVTSGVASTSSPRQDERWYSVAVDLSRASDNQKAGSTLAFGTTYKLVGRKDDSAQTIIAEYGAYTVPSVGTPEIHDANDQAVSSMSISSTTYLTPYVLLGSNTARYGTMIAITPANPPVASDTYLYNANDYTSATKEGIIGHGRYITSGVASPSSPRQDKRWYILGSDLIDSSTRASASGTLSFGSSYKLVGRDDDANGTIRAEYSTYSVPSVGTPEIHDANDNVASSQTISSTIYLTPTVKIGSNSWRYGTMISISPPNVTINSNVTGKNSQVSEPSGNYAEISETTVTSAGKWIWFTVHASNGATRTFKMHVKVV